MEALWPILWQSVLLPAGCMLLGGALAMMLRRWPWASQSVFVLAVTVAAIAVDVSSRGGWDYWPADATRRPPWLGFAALILIPFYSKQSLISFMAMLLLFASLMGIHPRATFVDPRSQYLLLVIGSWCIIAAFWLTFGQASTSVTTVELGLALSCFPLTGVMLLNHSASLAQQALGTGAAWVLLVLLGNRAKLTRKAATLVALFLYVSWVLASAQFSELPATLTLLLLLAPVFPVVAERCLLAAPRWMRFATIISVALIPACYTMLVLQDQKATTNRAVQQPSFKYQ